ncbi:MAG: HAD family hydrolase [Promethearchaeota archaeon]|jgi:phosphoglycolate phosphatase
MEDSKKIVLSFDLDYTLINNKKGIVNSFNYAMRKFNLPKVKRSIIEKMIGLPLNEMFAKFTDLNPSKLSSMFREYYKAKGIYQSILLSGVKTRLKEFKSCYFTLGVVTSKKQDIALKILRYLGIESYFDYVIGETDKIKSKTDPLLFKTLTDSYPGYNFIIIGDHPKDALLAKGLNCPFIGVLTGFYNSNQLKQARADNSQTVIIKKIKFLSVDMVNSIRN